MWIVHGDMLINLSQFAQIFTSKRGFSICLSRDSNAENNEELYFETEAERDALFEEIKAKVLGARKTSDEAYQEYFEMPHKLKEY